MQGVKGVLKKMLRTLAKRIVPVLVTVFMVFGLLPGGGFDINLNADPIAQGTSDTLQFAATAVDVDEATGSVTLTVTRTGGSSGTVTAAYATANGTAVASSDYTAQNNTLTFEDGDTSKDIVIALTDDATREAAETFTVTLSSPAGGATLGTNNPATVTIHDYVDAITVSSVGGTTTVLNGGTLQLSATVSPVDANPEVDWSVTSGTGGASIDGDGLLSATKAGTVTVKATSKTEPLKSGTFNVTVLPNEESFQFSPTAYSVNENEGSVYLIITRTGGSDGRVTMGYATANGTASGADYTGITGTLTFEAGETSKSILARVVDDAVHESNETFSVTLSNVSSGTISAPTATVTIVDDDIPVTGINVRAEGGVAGVQAGRTLAMFADVQPATASVKTVTWSVENGTGTATINPTTGVLSATKAGTVQVMATSVSNPNVSASMIITITAQPVTVTGVTVSPSSTSVRKGDSKTFTATVRGTGGPSQDVIWSMSGNRKSSTSISSSGKLRIADNETARTLTVRATSVVDHSEYGTAKVTVKARSSDDDDDDDDDYYDYDDIEITDSDSDISYDLTHLSLPSGVSSISVGSRQVSGSVINSDIKALTQRIGTVGSVRVYDLSLLDQDDDEISDFSGRIRVRLPIPSGYSGDLRVYRYNDFSETITDMDATKSYGYLVFDTSRLGYFAIVKYTGAARPAIPETGARTPPFIPVAAAVLIAAFGIALYRAKKRSA